MTVTSPATHEFLARQPDLVLATVRSDGSPQLSPLWYLWTGEEFLISTIEATAKWANLLKDARCSVCVDLASTGQMVVAYGVATLQTDSVWDPTYDLVAKYYPGDTAATEAHMERIWAGPKRVLIRVRPDKMITRKIDE